MEGQKTELKMIRMSEVESQEVKWLWYPFIPYGKLTIIQGDPGDGKTTLVLNIAAKLSKGECLDSDMDVQDPVNVIYQTAEDGLADTVKPRLEIAGADCEKILVIDEKGEQTMKEKIYDARTGMEYVLVGDYYLPALKLPRTRPIGRWGMLHKAYLKLRKPAYYQSLLLSGKLDTVLANVEEQAVERYEVLIEQLSRREHVSEKLKEENQMEWVRRMRNLENRAAEIVKAELIYTFEGR